MLTLFYQRLCQTVLGVGDLISIAATVANPALVDGVVASRRGSIYLIAVFPQSKITAVGAVLADRFHLLRLPDTDFVPEIGIGQRPDRTNLDQVAAVKRINLLAGRGVDLGDIAAIERSPKTSLLARTHL